MRDMMRLIATLTIWVVFATVVGVALSSATGPLNNADGGQITGIVAIIAAAATISTIAVWTTGRQDSPSRSREIPVARGKTKRVERDRVERLVDSLDDEEIYDLEALLLSRHEESGTRERPSGG
jgi:hypothetical protein